MLIDVRTDAEWAYVGSPSLVSVERPLLRISWQEFPGMEVNRHFVEQISASGAQKDQTLLFICRSGARSKSAAISCAAAGFTRCHNVAEGFEGDRNADGHRGEVSGWKKRGLPWVQN